MGILYLTHHQIHWIFTITGLSSAVMAGYVLANHTLMSLGFSLLFGSLSAYCYGSILAEYRLIDPFYDHIEEPQQERDT